jgi:hypothetical protein
MFQEACTEDAFVAEADRRCTRARLRSRLRWSIAFKHPLSRHTFSGDGEQVRVVARICSSKMWAAFSGRRGATRYGWIWRDSTRRNHAGQGCKLSAASITVGVELRFQTGRVPYRSLRSGYAPKGYALSRKCAKACWVPMKVVLLCR